MALSGSCQTSTWTSSSDSSVQAKLVFNWTATQNQSNNTSTISWNIKASVTKGWVNFSELSVKINGSTVYSRGESVHTSCSNGTQLASGTKVLTHNANGACSFTVAIGAGIYSWAINKTGSGSFTLNPHTVYTLSISAGTGSTIAVNRTASGYASTGSVSNGAKLYYGDKLAVTFSASNGYGLSGHTVNGTNLASGGTHTVGSNVTIASTALAAYTLSISAGAGSSITVVRTSSSVDGVGAGGLANGATVYKNDLLKITFTPNNNYEILAHTVNGTTFTSGNTHTVNGNVTVVSTARVLASSVGATNADIGSVSTITVSKYNDSYYHTLQYSFGSLSGYITSNGGTSSTPVRFSQTSIAFTVPIVFYTVIPNAKNGTCTITCRTYQDDSTSTQLGESTTCTFVATANANDCAPDVYGSIVDINEVTNALTGNSAVLVKYKSSVECTIRAVAKNQATIVSRSINGVSPTLTDGFYKTTFNNIQSNSFVFTATDSRGYSTSITITPTMVEYVILTCNPTVTRSAQTGNDFDVYLSGNYFRGAFNQGTQNTLEIEYQYKESSSSVWSALTQVSSGITYGNSNYSVSFIISIQDQLAYKKAYDIKIVVRDGHTTVNNSDVYLSTVVKTVSMPQGAPIFDWGQSDFNINVDTSVVGDLDVGGDINARSDVNVTGNANINSDVSVGGDLDVNGDITVNGNSIAIKTAMVNLTNVPITTQSNMGAYYASGYSPSDYGISGTIIGLMIAGWTGATASFVPYYQSSKIRFVSDVSQTVSTINVLVTYI